MKEFTVDEITDFVFANYVRARVDWDRSEFFKWCSWHISQGFCLMAGQGEEIMGLLLMRPTLTPHECIGNLEFDVEGDTLFVDLCVAVKPKRKVLQCLAFSVIERFGRRDKVAYQHQGSGPVLVTDAKEHLRKLLTSKEMTPHVAT